MIRGMTLPTMQKSERSRPRRLVNIRATNDASCHLGIGHELQEREGLDRDLAVWSVVALDVPKPEDETAFSFIIQHPSPAKVDLVEDVSNGHRRIPIPLGATESRAGQKERPNGRKRGDVRDRAQLRTRACSSARWTTSPTSSVGPTQTSLQSPTRSESRGISGRQVASLRKFDRGFDEKPPIREGGPGL